MGTDSGTHGMDAGGSTGGGAASGSSKSMSGSGPTR
jgi:hypothetical protein